ncbi:unnamed protein product [Penicillium manginii]
MQAETNGNTQNETIHMLLECREDEVLGLREIIINGMKGLEIGVDLFLCICNLLARAFAEGRFDPIEAEVVGGYHSRRKERARTHQE